MTSLRIRRIQCTDADLGQYIAALRGKLGPQTDFGAEPASSPAHVVDRICADVRTRGLRAVLEYTEKFDRVRLTRETLRVTTKELAEAHASADPAFLDTLQHVRQKVLSFQLGLVHQDAILSVAGRHQVRLRYRPMRRVGICVPGGAASYPSTLLMTVCPAQAAGVKEIAVVIPPTPRGAHNPDLLATCHELGVKEVYRIGGAQAVAALAYGVDGLPAVDMIVGPGNIFVTLAKRHVYGHVAIDMLAGPTEVVVLADESASPEFVAADMISQAEHAPGAAILVTWHAPLIEDVLAALDRQLPSFERGTLARESLEAFGALLLARDSDEAVTCVNLIAPEHLHIATQDPEAYVDKVENAGAIFLGHHTPVALGDYVAGPSHVLPTGGTARFASGLSANDFLRRSSVIAFSRAGLAEAAPHVRLLADKEGLTAHAASVDVRLKERRSAPMEAQAIPRSSSLS
jgi:histidinol dehydrogenase